MEGDQIQAHTQGGNGGGIRSRPTPKGEIEGDQIQAHTQGEIEGDQIQATPKGKLKGIRSRPHPREKLKGIRSRPPSPREANCGIRSMSGWYASYWNAFLFFLNILKREKRMKPSTQSTLVQYVSTNLISRVKHLSSVKDMNMYVDCRIQIIVRSKGRRQGHTPPPISFISMQFLRKT